MESQKSNSTGMFGMFKSRHFQPAALPVTHTQESRQGFIDEFHKIFYNKESDETKKSHKKNQSLNKNATN